MSGIEALRRRVVHGQRRRSAELGRPAVGKRVAVPVYGSDMVSSTAYAPDEILLTLAVAGVAATQFSWPVAVAVVVVLAVVAASYRETIRAFPTGGGDYDVARSALGPRASVLVGASLLVDYALVVAVSVAAATAYLVAAVPSLAPWRVVVALVLVALLGLRNLRGAIRWTLVRALPTYLFLGLLIAISVWGWSQTAVGNPPRAVTADLELVVQDPYTAGFTGLAAGMLLLRAFSVGSVSLAGVHTVVAGTPSFTKPRTLNARRALSVLAVLAGLSLLSIIGLASVTGVQVVEDPATQLTSDGVPVGEDYVQVPVLGQLLGALAGDTRLTYGVVAVLAVSVLLLASHVAFTAFPVLGSILARDGYLPRQMHTRGDTLAFTGGVRALTVAAGALLVLFAAEVTALIQLYVVGVFVAFVVGQAGMVVLLTGRLADEHRPQAVAALRRSRTVSIVGVAVTSLVLVVVLISKLTRGAWIALLLIAVMAGLMLVIRRHYDAVSRETAVDAVRTTDRQLPSRVHALILVSKLHKPTLRAVAYARASSPGTLEAVTVDVDPVATRALLDEWDASGLPVPLRVLDSPYREITGPVVEYVKGIRRASPRDVVAVYIPEYVIASPVARVLHNRSAERLKQRLANEQRVMVTSVPWQLDAVDEQIERARDAVVPRPTVRE